MAVLGATAGPRASDGDPTVCARVCRVAPTAVQGAPDSGACRRRSVRERVQPARGSCLQTDLAGVADFVALVSRRAAAAIRAPHRARARVTHAAVAAGAGIGPAAGTRD